ncbi:hypothetical protein F7725_007193 [Dissostichus mawsoni]|uniref:Vacuolar protein sorting-associated protein 51 homolog n=1 Tax=Dissostichus mawsoni TaxID=36200 RepID=A0A7J5XWR1_DISMA|nr:hypothetical protein F7725_007193 [Dissostichus mawsoni]
MDAEAVVSEDSGPDRKRRVHGMLKLYYGLNEEGKVEEEAQSLDPCDINGPHFDPEHFLNKLRRECSLAELMDQETCMVKQIRSLDSDMQTLVYENYNKFISATDTIRKMKNDFKKMEDEMDCLSANMSAITDFSAQISGTLQDQHAQITKLSGVHTLLRKLQFLFELPARLNKCLEMQAYAQAVRSHRLARCVLQQYSHLPSFKGIQDDCHAIMDKLAQELRQKFRDGGSSAKDLSECVELLLQLDEPAEELCDKFLSHARSRLESDLQGLEAEIRPYPSASAVKDASVRRLSSPASTGSPAASSPKASAIFSPSSNTDILEFIDRGCNEFVSSLCLVITSYQELFVSHAQTGELASKNIPQMANAKLHAFVDDLAARYFSLVERRIQEEKGVGDNSLLVRALDRFHRRLQAVTKLLPGSSVPSKGTEIVIRAATERVKQYLAALQSFYMDSLTDVRQALATPRLSVASASVGGGGGPSGRDGPNSLPELLSSLSASILNQIKSVLASGEFCSQGVRESLVVSFIKFICQSSRQFCESAGDKGGSTPPALLLLLSRLCLDYETSTISYILTLTDEQFLVQHHSPVTPVTTLCTEAREAAQKLLNHYVKVQGLIISQMLRKSVETRDWVNTIEPRNVRAVMKRVVEDTTSIDVQVGLLYEEGVRKAHSSDSSKRTFSVYSSSRQQVRYAASYTPSAPMDTNLLSNIHKLFSERIDIQLSGVSVMTGIIKISLKTFLECVRLRTFGRYGLQQIQVDCHYLQMYLWRFVSDENLVHFLLDEIVGSSAHRCLDPAPMEQSVIEACPSACCWMDALENNTVPSTPLNRRPIMKPNSQGLKQRPSHDTEREFGGTLGALCIPILLPLTVMFLICVSRSPEASLLQWPPALPSTDQLWDPLALVLLLGWISLHALLYVLPLGKVSEGLVLRNGTRLKYPINGFHSLCISGVLLMLLLGLGAPLGSLFELLLPLAACAIAGSYLFSLYLYIRSFWVPSHALASGGNTGNPLYDFFIGRELNPRIGNFDLKYFCELRPGLIGWVVINLGMLMKEVELRGSPSLAMILVNSFQLLYVADALWNEAAFLVVHPQALSSLGAAAIIALNGIGYYVFRKSNSQKNQFRRDPTHPSVARLETIATATGKRLLVSGWWGLVRHPNYLGDLLMALAWSLPCGFSHLLPYFYVIYFAVLLIHREDRDERQCRAKYGLAWDTYCQRVPYRIFPYVY